MGSDIKGCVCVYVSGYRLGKCMRAHLNGVA